MKKDNIHDTGITINLYGNLNIYEVDAKIDNRSYNTIGGGTTSYNDTLKSLPQNRDDDELKAWRKFWRANSL